MLDLNKHERNEDASVIKNLEKIFSSLGSEDALKIFQEAKEGIRNSTETKKKLGLTQKRYYTRLNELLKVGLLQKQDGAYRHTSLGKICYQIGGVLLEAVNNSEQLELMDKVAQSPSLSTEEREKVIRAVSRSGLANFADLLNGGIKPVGIVTKLEDIVAGAKRLIEKAQKEVYLATRYTDSSVDESILNSLDRGIKMYLLDGDKKSLSQKIQLIRLIFSRPRLIKLFYEIFRSPNVYTGYTDDLPYSFIVVDGKYVGVEIPKPHSNDFFLGLFFENELLSRKLVEVFNLLTTKAKEDPKKEFSQEIFAQFTEKKWNKELSVQE